MMPPRLPLTVVKLSDHFGQYVCCSNASAAATRARRSPRRSPLSPVGMRSPCGCSEAVAMLTLRQETMQCHGASRDETGRLNRQSPCREVKYSGSTEMNGRRDEFNAPIGNRISSNIAIRVRQHKGHRSLESRVQLRTNVFRKLQFVPFTIHSISN